MLRNPRIWEHLRDRVGSLHGRRFSEVQALQVAEAIVALTHSTEAKYRRASLNLKVRPPRCMHGGFTRAVA
jgi:predicted Zn-ribbon and HTH transcriptional regulator